MDKWMVSTGSAQLHGHSFPHRYKRAHREGHIFSSFLVNHSTPRHLPQQQVRDVVLVPRQGDSVGPHRQARHGQVDGLHGHAVARVELVAHAQIAEVSNDHRRGVTLCG